jgi:hypothetical protein
VTRALVTVTEYTPRTSGRLHGRLSRAIGGLHAYGRASFGSALRGFRLRCMHGSVCRARLRMIMFAVLPSLLFPSPRVCERGKDLAPNDKAQHAM